MVTYSKTTWANGSAPALNATNLNNIENGIKNCADAINAIYPVGSIYMSVVNTSPATFFGGTWERIQGQFLLGASSSYTAGSTGGEATHTLTVQEMPSHNHKYYFDYGEGSSADWGIGIVSGTAEPTHSVVASGPQGRAYTMNIKNTGGGGAHNNMPPYLAVYMWKRTA